ncbi:MAG: hypothetical protein EXS47_02350 [Candidatus Zambryskibacteria bacterium]|nr:hypothetical protein [Candidatus Zambryskibacteria bacterium]
MTTLKKILSLTHDVQDKYFADRDHLVHQVKLIKEAGFTIALTQGVYDMFHVGHGRYLADASACGDILIVGVDSDELTRSMKGPDRPFDTFDERIEILAMLAFVNIIAMRDVGEHKYDLIKLVRPDVLVMSKTTSTFGDEDKAILEDFCGEIRHLEARAATSTTAKLRRLKIEGMKELGGQVQSRVETFSKEIVELIGESLKRDGDGK